MSNVEGMYRKENRRTEEYRISNVEGRYSVYFIKRKQRMTEEKEDKSYDLEERLIGFHLLKMDRA